MSSRIDPIGGTKLNKEAEMLTQAYSRRRLESNNHKEDAMNTRPMSVTVLKSNEEVGMFVRVIPKCISAYWQRTGETVTETYLWGMPRHTIEEDEMIVQVNLQRNPDPKEVVVVLDRGLLYWIEDACRHLKHRKGYALLRSKKRKLSTEQCLTELLELGELSAMIAVSKDRIAKALADGVMAELPSVQADWLRTLEEDYTKGCQDLVEEMRKRRKRR